MSVPDCLQDADLLESLRQIFLVPVIRVVGEETEPGPEEVAYLLASSWTQCLDASLERCDRVRLGQDLMPMAEDVDFRLLSILRDELSAEPLTAATCEAIFREVAAGWSWRGRDLSTGVRVAPAVGGFVATRWERCPAWRLAAPTAKIRSSAPFPFAERRSPWAAVDQETDKTVDFAKIRQKQRR
jgi:hypothetical protein